jgi:hypothetical protein
MRQDEYRDKVETESTCSSNPTAVMVKELSPSALECENDNFRGPDDDAGTALAYKGRSPTPTKLRHQGHLPLLHDAATSRRGRRRAPDGARGKHNGKQINLILKLLHVIAVRYLHLPPLSCSPNLLPTQPQGNASSDPDASSPASKWYSEAVARHNALEELCALRADCRGFKPVSVLTTGASQLPLLASEPRRYLRPLYLQGLGGCHAQRGGVLCGARIVGVKARRSTALPLGT